MGDSLQQTSPVRTAGGDLASSKYWNVIRPVCVAAVGLAIAAGVAIFRSPLAMSPLLLGATVLLAGVLIHQVIRASRHLEARATSAHRGASEAGEHYITVLQRIVRFVEARDKYWGGHSQRVGALSEQIARGLGLDEDECARMSVAGQLHDIGRLALPDGLLRDPSDIGVEGFRTIQKHPQISYEVLRPLGSLRDALPAIRHHHERMNGTGYPSGLAGEAIPLGARILAVADAYDAMTHDRPHRRAISSPATVQELRRCSPHGYDPDCVDALADALNLPSLGKSRLGESDVSASDPVNAGPSI
jgi:HD-GYP domain-containing protein (c-di-GMP phosphodiesterase class II)